MTRVLFVVPEGVDDPERVSGGNVYDRRVRDGLAAIGWDVRTSAVGDGEAVAAALAELPRDGIALVDGLVAGWAPDAIGAAAATARVVVLAHMVAAAFPDADPQLVDRERRALARATAVIATSEWTASQLVRRGSVQQHRVTVALPGAVQGALADGEAGRLLCVGAVAHHKGQDILLDALHSLRGLEWTCTFAGSHGAEPVFADRVATAAAGLGSRVRMPGVLDDAALRAAYRRSGLLVAPSRAESFGIAIGDARGRGLPVIAAAVGGIPEAVAGGGALLVNGDDPAALASALERWMTDPALRARLRAEAAAARTRAPRWAHTVAIIDRVLVAA
ncbi:MAG: glycosyltransferase family 4 protein [Pseudolysinimonas sp.]